MTAERASAAGTEIDLAAVLRKAAMFTLLVGQTHQVKSLAHTGSISRATTPKASFSGG